MNKKSFFIVICVYIFLLNACSDRNDSDDIIPKGKSTISTFYPEKGGIADKFIVKGDNFGKDVSRIKVYFNDKRAAVISSDGSTIYSIVPKSPGDMCIVSVVVNEDSLVFEKQFEYETSVTVSTVAGNGTASFNGGSLSETTLRPYFLAVDNEKNIFASIREGSDWGIIHVNEEEDLAYPVTLATTSSAFNPNAPAVDRLTGVFTFPSETSIHAFVTCDPKEAWAPRHRNFRITQTNGYDLPSNSWKHSMAACELDGYVYTRFYDGQIIKIHPKTYEAEIIFKTPNGTSNGLTFSPTEPHLMYIVGRSGGVAGGIFTLDIRDPQNTFKRINADGSGYRDGEIAVALFNAPWQVYFDPEGNLYIADANNHCIRRMTPHKIVETVVGVPGVAGWKDGGREDALFNEPRGVGVDHEGTVYIADYGNNRIRKLSIE